MSVVVEALSSSKIVILSILFRLSPWPKKAPCVFFSFLNKMYYFALLVKASGKDAILFPLVLTSTDTTC